MRRVRTNECAAVLTAEDVYTALLREGAERMRAGVRGDLTWTLEGREQVLAWELRANSVWRRGRVFLHCPRCARLATRIYWARVSVQPACRRCLGLAYESQQRDYKIGRSPLSMFFGALVYTLTETAREVRAEKAAKRYAERREILRR